MTLILASASPRRRELLERAGVPFEVRAEDVDETPYPGESPMPYVQRVALLKANASAARFPGRWVLAADTTVTIDGVILAKAADGDEATAMLRRLSGRTHQVHTAFALVGRSTLWRVVTTDVAMVAMSAQDIAEYVASREWDGKAGAYAIQGIAAGFVRELRGSVTNVIGLPLVEVLDALRDFRELGAPQPRFSGAAP